MAENGIEITINGQKYTAEPHETVLQVLLRNGITVPHFCYHPKLTVAGVCRMCLVEVEGSRKLEVSCALPVSDGMVVHTESPQVLEGRQFVMEFTLVNHPIDCPICDQAGECWLQEYYMAHDRAPSSMEKAKVHKDKAKPIGPRVILDQERCILCTRCVRFCDEITETSEIGIFNRGDRSILDVAPGKTLDNPYSENVIDICPVGALTSRDFRFDGRVWFLKEEPSICPGCARGCNTVLQHREGRIRRILPRQNDEVNGHWMCDAGRDIYKWVHADNRLKTPLVLEESKSRLQSGSRSVDWNESFEVALHCLKTFQENHSGKGLAGIASVRATNEDNVVFCRFMENVVGAQFISWQDLTPKTWKADDLLKVEDQNPNSQGAEKIIRAATDRKFQHLDTEGLLNRLEDGSIRGLIILEQDLFAGASNSLRKRLEKALAKLDLLISFATHEHETARLADVAFPVATFAEQDGSFTNFSGKVQHFRAAISPVGQSLPARKVLEGLAKKLKISLSIAEEVLGEDLQNVLSEYALA